jgi:hypothetical protein
MPASSGRNRGQGRRTKRQGHVGTKWFGRRALRGLRRDSQGGQEGCSCNQIVR